MENNQINIGEAIPCIADSKDSEKAFLLQLASKLCPTATEDKSEKERLKILHLRLNRLAKLFSTLTTRGVRMKQRYAKRAYNILWTSMNPKPNVFNSMKCCINSRFLSMSW